MSRNARNSAANGSGPAPGAVPALFPRPEEGEVAAGHAGEAVDGVADPPPPRHGGALEGGARRGRQQRVRVRVAVEDAHEALAVGDELADPPVIERRLVAPCGGGPGEEARER